MAELGLYDDLLGCLDAADRRWTEHGVIEHRYLTAHPDIYFGQLLPLYGHASQGPMKGLSTSLLLAMALSQLRSEGLLVYRTWRPTGYWKKNSKISYWATPPDPPEEDRLTWAGYAAELGLDPKDWDFQHP